ncbi:protein kinase domain-containing protein [Aporhodopirellula aestuarii]|uniref:Protein kinase n=1 Tax=Aporhodopirellula aestuarii TaxID=2950107 RepID=A0ABT0UBV7_9BACT|nr:protein kinase [Aporhodopirellula aestuarii]MCM2374482.1 protein kinase [Aporhodopirellula aestuarii]
MPAVIQRGLEIVPGYTLVRRLGSGMAGEVWVARASGGVYVAVKVVRDMGMIGSKRELGALRIVREVKHTNLCPLIGVWFFDAEGELLSNSATDEILGRESSLIDTECLGGERDPDGVRETHAMGLADSAVDPDSSEKSGTSDSQLRETGEYLGDASSGFLAALGRKSASPTAGETERSDSSIIRTPGDRRNEDDQDASLGEARQMVIAMGLGEKTLHDRLVEMRAPGNAPEGDDPLHLPGGVPAPELLRYITGAASAIDELNIHHNIYHCDIKPQNILIVGGNAQVCDFGLARRVHENRRTQLAIGTPAYGAPEMLFDQTYTKTIDQYSLAITYYELRTGSLPFETSRRSSFLRAKANGELQLGALSQPEREVIERATRLDPAQRYSSCSEFAEKLSEAVLNKGKSGATSRRSHALIATAIFLGCLAGGGLYLYLANQTPSVAEADNGDATVATIPRITPNDSTDIPLAKDPDANVSPSLTTDLPTDVGIEPSRQGRSDGDSAMPETEEPNVALETRENNDNRSQPDVSTIPSVPPGIVESPASSNETIESDANATEMPNVESTESSDPAIEAPPTKQPETIEEHLALARADLDRWDDADGADLSIRDLQAFVSRLEKFAPTLDEAGNWIEPEIAKITDLPYEERFVAEGNSIADRFRQSTLRDSSVAFDASMKDAIAELAARVDLTSLSSLVWLTSRPNSNVAPLERQTLIEGLPTRAAVVRDSFIADNQFPANNRAADASYTLARIVIDDKGVTQFNGEQLDSIATRSNDLRRAMMLNTNATRLTRVAESQMQTLVALRRTRDAQTADDRKVDDEIASIDRMAIDLVQQLGQTASHADRKQGWDRVSGKLRLIARTVAGLVMWDSNRVSDAMKNWIDVQNDPMLELIVPDVWREDVAYRCLDWLQENSGAADDDIETIRHARSITRSTGVLDLAQRFAGQSNAFRIQVQPERFLLVAASGDLPDAMKIWDSMNMSLDDARRTPQVGFALWQLVSRRLNETIQDSERSDLAGKLVFASVGQLDSSDIDKPFNVTANADETLVSRFTKAIDAVRELTSQPVAGSPVIPSVLDRPELTVLCHRYLDAISRSTAPMEYANFLDRLDRVEFAAATAAAREKNAQLRDELYLIAAEAFIQKRYEEIDDLPASVMIERLFAYEAAAERNSDSPPSVYRTFLFGRAEDQRGFISREDDDARRHYSQARDAYTKVIDSRDVPADLRGSAYRCRAGLLSRMAVLETPPRSRELLELASEDAAAAIALPPRWHFDNDDRLTTAAEVDISTVRLATDLDLPRVQELLDDADRFLAEAIAVRNQRGYPVYMQETHRLNGYLFDLLKSPKGRRHSNREQKAMTLMSQLATEPIPESESDGIEMTIAVPSIRTKVHWHCMCAMVHRLAEHPEMSMSHIRYAIRIAEQHLPQTDERRHRAVLIYIEFKGYELLEGIKQTGRPNLELVKELNDLLDTVVDPSTQLRIKKEGYLRDLEAMVKKQPSR